MKKPVFSVIIPSYNHEKYIGGAIESVINQTFKDWELIIIDDGSSDKSVEIIKQCKDPRIRLLTQENHDAPYTINRGIKEAKGDYIAILNSDDLFEKDKLQNCFDFLYKGYDFVFGKIKVIDEKNEEMSVSDQRVEWINEKLNESGEAATLEKLLLNINYFITTSNFVFKKEIIEKVGFFHEKLHYSHDFDFLLRLYANGIKIKFIPSYVCFYRIHTDSTLSKGKAEAVIEACYSIAKLTRSVPDSKELIPVDLFKSPIYASVLLFLTSLTDDELEKIILGLPKKTTVRLKEIIIFYIEDSIRIEKIVKNNQREIALLIQENSLMKSSHFWKLRNAYLAVKKFLHIKISAAYFYKFFQRRVEKNKGHFDKLFSFLNIPLVLFFKLLGKFIRKQPKEKYPLVSVVIPCYNYGKFINEAINSVLASTYQNVEIIVVDDGPTDPFTIELLSKMNKPKTRVIFQENQGLARARSTGISGSKGSYILPLDADDKIDPTYIEKALYVLQQNPFRSFAYGYAQLFGSENTVWFTGEYDLERLKKENIILSCSLFRKEVWEKVGGYENDRYQYDDWTFWLKLGANGFFGKLIPEILLFHRRHGGQENMTERLRLRHEEYHQKIKRLLPGLYRRFFLTKVWDKISRFITKRKELYWRNTFSSLETESSTKKKLLVFLPWAIRGGAEKVTLDFIKNLDDWEVFIVTTLENKYDSAVDMEFKSIAKAVYHLPNFLSIEEYWHFVKGLISSQKIKNVLINHCAWAYENSENIKNRFNDVNIFDLLHNAMEGGYKDWSKKYGQWITETIVISQKLRAHLIKKMGFPEKKVKCILNGVDTEVIFNPDGIDITGTRRELGLPENKKTITFVGRLSPEKNPLKFVDVAREINRVFPGEYCFVMVGGGDLTDTVVEKINLYFNKEDFICLGNYSHPEKVLALSHFLINTSVIEGMPLTIIEALAMKVPVIAPSIGAVGEIVADGYNGYLLRKEADIEDYIEAVRKSREEKVYLKLRGNARLSVVDKYSSKRMAKEYEQVFNSH